MQHGNSGILDHSTQSQGLTKMCGKECPATSAIQRFANSGNAEAITIGFDNGGSFGLGSFSAE